jgi:hypothetical protein
MFVFPSNSFLKWTHTYVLRPYPLNVTKTLSFSETFSISLSYFCEQLCLPSKRRACVGCGYNNSAETHTCGFNNDIYVLLSCWYICILTLAHVFERIHLLFLMYTFDFRCQTSVFRRIQSIICKCAIFFSQILQFCDVCSHFANVSIVFLTCTCFFFDKAVWLSYVYITIATYAWYYLSACVNFVMSTFFFADVCAILLTCLCVLTWHIRRFSDKDVCMSFVYITIDTHASYFLSTCVTCVLYALL